MKKRMLFVLALALLLCLMGTAGAEDYVNGGFTIYCAGGETIQPEYPDLSGKIGEGLTQDDFLITYECSNVTIVTMDAETGQVTVAEGNEGTYRYEVYVTYTPKTEGVGKKTVFLGYLYTGTPYAYLRVEDGSTEITLGVGQSIRRRIVYNSYLVPSRPSCRVENSEIVTAKLETAGQYTSANNIIITAVAPGETTVTAYTYNGMTADIHVKVLAAPTELTFAQDVYECYVGEKLSLGVKLGDGEHMASFSEAKINYYQAYDYFEGGITGYFCHDHSGDYTLRATTYNGFSDTALIRVFDKTPAADVKLSADIVRVGENIKVESFDAEGNYVRARYISITKGSDIASLDVDKLITTAPGEIEVTVTNLDGTTVSRTFNIEPYPNEIIFNVDELTLEIGETFEIEVGFDQGWLEYQWWGTEYPDPVPYYLYPTRFDDGVVTAQAPGKSTYRCTAGTLSKTITITVPDSDKALSVHAPENPVGVGETFQIQVVDKTGKVYPGTYSLASYETNATVTEQGYFTALKKSMAVNVGIDLEDGRHLTYKVIIVQKPLWLRVAAETITMDESIRVSADSDQGEISPADIKVTIADESVLKQNGNYLYPQKKGKTYVTYTSVYSGVSTTFLVQVVSEKPEYAATSTMYLPYGVSAYVPKVYNSYGDEVVYRWKISIDNPGEGNPNSTGFTLEEKVITCNWPTATCELIGTKWDGSERVKVVVYGFKLPDEIWLEPEIIDLALGTSQSVEVLFDEAGSEIRGVYWAAETEGIVSFKEYTSGTKNYLKANAVGLTLIMAILDNETYALCLVNVYDPNARIPGDADDNRTVNIYDALTILKYLSGETVGINLSNAEVTGDGQLSVQDAMLIMKKGAGWNVTLK